MPVLEMKSMPQFNKQKSVITPQQGLDIDDSDSEMFQEALSHAVDYRGDIMLTLKPDHNRIVGYLFDRQLREDESKSVIRIIPSDGTEKKTVLISDISRIKFSGKDTASGKSFETWMKKYTEKKLAGREASIESESLDDQV